MIRSDAGGPSPDPAVVAALKRIEPGLYAVWRNHLFDVQTGRDIVAVGNKKIRWPRWHIYLSKDGQDHHLFMVEDDERNFLPLDQRVPKKILADAGRHMTPDQIEDMLRRSEEDRKFRAEQDLLRDHAEFNYDNKHKIEEVFHGKNLEKGPSQNTRDQTIVSYTGQPIRSSGWDNIPTTAKEEGWVGVDEEVN